VPRFYPEALDNSKPESSSERVRVLTHAARRALVGNASYILEPKFRERILQILRAWALKELDYSSANSDLDEAFSKRSRLVARIIPGTGVARTLMAFGFFSASRLVFSGPISNLQTGLQPRVAEAGLLLRNPPKIALAVIRDMRRSRNGVQGPFSYPTRRYFDKHLPTSNNVVAGNAGKCLVVGPSQVGSWPSLNNFDSVIIMVTLSNNLGLLKQRISSLSAAVILNGEAGVRAIMEGPGSEWIAVLKTAKHIYCRRDEVRELEILTGVPTSARESNLLNLWGGYGGPHLTQVTLGLLISLGMRAHVVGVNLYLAEKTYEQFSTQDTQLDSIKGDFATCMMQSVHNPVMDFLISCKLMAAGYVLGDDELQGILGMGLDEYLSALDKSIGSSRK